MNWGYGFTWLRKRVYISSITKEDGRFSSALLILQGDFISFESSKARLQGAVFENQSLTGCQ